MAKPEKIAELRYYLEDGAIDKVPVFPVDGVPKPYVKFDLGNQTGSVVMLDPSKTSTNSLRLQTQDGVKQAHSPKEVTKTFTYNGESAQTWSPPDSVIGTVEVILEGAGGGAGGPHRDDDDDDYAGDEGNDGGRLTATLSVDADNTLYLYPPEGGGAGSSGSYQSGGDGGWGGHTGSDGDDSGIGVGGASGGGGGGAAEIRLNGTDDSSAILSAGGGNGGSGKYGPGGGPGGAHNSEQGSGLVIDGGSVLSHSITNDGGASGGAAYVGSGSYPGNDGKITVKYFD